MLNGRTPSSFSTVFALSLSLAFGVFRREPLRLKGSLFVVHQPVAHIHSSIQEEALILLFAPTFNKDEERVQNPAIHRVGAAPNDTKSSGK